MIVAFIAIGNMQQVFRKKKKPKVVFLVIKPFHMSKTFDMFSTSLIYFFGRGHATVFVRFYERKTLSQFFSIRKLVIT